MSGNVRGLHVVQSGMMQRINHIISFNPTAVDDGKHLDLIRRFRSAPKKHKCTWIDDLASHLSSRIKADPLTSFGVG